MLKKNFLPIASIAGISALIFALCLNGPRPTCSLAKTTELTAQMTSVDGSNSSDDLSQNDSSESDDDDTHPSQNSSNSYEEIHDEIVMVPPQISKPYFSYFSPQADTVPEGLTLSKLPRPPRSA